MTTERQIERLIARRKRIGRTLGVLLAAGAHPREARCARLGRSLDLLADRISDAERQIRKGY